MQLRLFDLFLVLGICCLSTNLAIGQGAQAPDKKIKLPTSLQKTLDEVILPAMVDNDHQTFLTEIIPVLKKSNPSRLDEIERYSVARNAGSIRARFVELTIQSIEMGIPLQNEINNLASAVWICNEVADRTEAFLNQTFSEAIFQDPIMVPEQWQQSEDFFWDVHVLSNHFQNHNRLFEFANEILRKNDKRMRRNQQAVDVQQRLEAEYKRLVETYQLVRQRFTEARLIRFRKAHRQLLAGGDFKTRLTSAMSLELDGKLIQNFLLENQGQPFVRPALNEPGLEAKVAGLLTEGQTIAGPISTKANLLRNGLHFWLRGRYGSGPMAYGLLKHPDAIQNQFAMEALYMPKERPLPISGYHGEESSFPGYDRRHFYTWAVEYRELMVTRGEQRSEVWKGGDLVFM